MNSRLLAALSALEKNRPSDAWAEAKVLIEKDAQDSFALALASASLQLLGHRAKATEYRKKWEAAPFPAFPGAAELDFMRRLDELTRTKHSSSRRFAEEAGKAIKKGNRKRAEFLLERAREEDPDCALIHFHRGVLAVAENRNTVARLCFVTALKADSTLARARTALANLVSGRGLSSILPLL